MASMQYCYKLAQETCQDKSLSSSYGPKSNSSGYYAGHSIANNQNPMYGQYPDHNLAKPQTHCSSQNQNYYPNPNMAKPQNHLYGQIYTSQKTDHTMAKPVNHSYGQTYSCNHTDYTVTKTRSNSMDTVRTTKWRLPATSTANASMQGNMQLMVWFAMERQRR
ncbi:hypothetical protein PanWU01x14_260700 [Parasponia andersonii]|uniref:Uncharacterized protein n=1 Tax=Parasponia andersonii TaxID=3476 RepID=A0A2P5B8W0_PARAD|nr:hypothetical protein PanWU01x14_260700 [Parasponia andersonii]